LSVEPSGEKWILEVADTGPGIPETLRNKVFQLYFTSKETGSGIGLAMTYRAAQLHNGTIGFTSEAGGGTTFRMEFPAAVPNA
jgi:signal transduction histidine kinase